MAPARSGQVFFGVDARHIRQLGQELVGDRVTAVTELAKNSYDADATLVAVRFSPANELSPSVSVAKRPMPFRPVDETLPLDYPRLVGPIEAEAAYFIYRANALGSIKVRAAQAMGRTYGGVRLYRDGLRVMPYGQPGFDWLGLDELQGSRSSTLAAIRNQNWFGQVLIGREPNPRLIDTASREGLVQNPAYNELRRVLRDGLVRAAERVASARGRKSRTDTKPDPATRTEVLSDAERTVIETVGGAKLPSEVAEQVSSLVHKAFRVAGEEASAADSAEQEYVASLVGEIELMRVLASLGTSIAVFNHEVQSVLNGPPRPTHPSATTLPPGASPWGRGRSSMSRERALSASATWRLTSMPTSALVSVANEVVP